MGIETLAIASLAGSVISGGMGFLGAMQQGEAASQSAKYQAQVARNNEIIATNNAQYAAESGAARAQAQDFKNRAALGELESQQAASGLDLESGSNADVRRGARNVARLDTETLYNNALLQVRGAQAQGVGFKAQAGLDELEGRNAQSAAMTRGFGSLLGGASSFSDKWLRYQNTGVPGFGSIF